MKPKLLSSQDQDRYLSGGDDDVDEDDGSESTSEDELYVNRDDEYDDNSPVPIHFQEREKYIKSEPELDGVKKKIAELKLKGFKGISFTSRNASDAYECLHIFSDPAIEPFSYSRSCVVEVQRECHYLCGEDAELSFQDYRDICWLREDVEKWRDIREFLLDPKSKEEYLSGAQTLEQKLQELEISYGPVRTGILLTVFEAVVKWWTGDSDEKDRERAISLIDDELKKVIKVRDNRFEEWFLKADYVKLKVDVARAVGIIKEIPDELADFALPGNFKWSSSEGIFIRTLYE